MKKDIHPESHPVIFKDTNANKEFIMMSTQTSNETEERDGIKYHIVRLDISSASHPFYTGKQTLLDSDGRLDKFRAKREKALALQKSREKTTA